MALEAIGQALKWELPPLPVVADSFYGNDFGFRQALRGHGLQYAVQVEAGTVVWTEDPSLPVPAPEKKKKTGRPRKYPPLEALKRPQSPEQLAHELLASAWKGVRWRAQEHPERVAEWLLIKWPRGENHPIKYWLAQLGPQPLGLRRLVRIAKARWRIEQDYRELKEELGLDHFEGRHWLG